MKKIPQGVITEIARQTGYTRTYVSQVIHGLLPVTDNNMKIAVVAKKVIEEFKKRPSFLRKKFNQLLGKLI